MISEWAKVSIESISKKIAMGPFGSNIKVETFVSDGVPIISGAHLKGARVSDHGFNYVSHEHAERLKNSIVYPGDIVFTHAGNVGQVAYIPPNCKYNHYILSQRQFYLRCDLEKAFPEFITYYFHNTVGQGQLLANVNSTGVPSIARPSTYLKSIEISLPPIEEQIAIAATLSCLDDKIELNNRINKSLEVMAQEIFKSWFVDFEPFQDGEFIKSELGMIPKGWKVGFLEEISNITMGQSPRGNSLNTDGIGTVFYQGSSDFGDRFPVVRKYTSEPNRLAKINDILLSVRAPVGDINIAYENCCIGRGLAAVSGKDNHESFTLYLLLNSKDKFKVFNSEGTVFGSINKDSLRKMKIVIPCIEQIILFQNTVEQVDKMIRTLTCETRTLQSFRDTLLPKLMSGEIRVPIQEE